MTPVSPPANWFNKLDKIITEFYWKNKKQVLN